MKSRQQQRSLPTQAESAKADFAAVGAVSTASLSSHEFAAYPAYTSQAAPINVPPDLPKAPLVVAQAELPVEIMADKIAAFAGREYLKGRDIFDLWLLKSRGVAPDWSLVRRKLEDYKIPPERLKDTSRLTAITPEGVGRELESFLPRQQRAILNPATLAQWLAEVRTLLEAAP